MYKFINAESTAVVHMPTSRCIYLDQPESIHSIAYAEWVADGNTADAYVAHQPYVAAPVDREAIVIAALAAIDAKSIRPMRDGDTEFLAKLNEQAKALREELAKI